MKTPVRPCPICASVQVDLLVPVKFVLPDDHPLAAGYDVVACGQCGFAYADTAVTQADYDLFYARHSKYEDDKLSTGGGGNSVDAERLNQTAAFLAERIPDRAARILDIGCANGGMLGSLKAAGFTALCGLDPSPACAANTRDLGVDAFAGSLFAIPPEAGQFDVVLLSHVLEHVQDLAGALSQIRSVLRPGGMLYLEVPDATRYAEFLAAPYQEFNTEHINHFSVVALQNLLSRSGFAITEAGRKTIPSPPAALYPAAFALARLTEQAGDAAPQRDVQTRPAIEEYCALSAQIMEGIDARLRRLRESHPRIVVWSVGQLTLKLLAQTALAEFEIAAFIDGNPIHHGERVLGVTVEPPDRLHEHPEPVVIASILHEIVIARTIRERLRLPNEIVFLREGSAAP